MRRGSNERTPLIRSRSYDDLLGPDDGEAPAAPVAGGTVLGVHNLAIVAPQLIVSSQGLTAPTDL